jgi:hypothetical protein
MCIYFNNPLLLRGRFLEQLVPESSETMKARQFLVAKNIIVIFETVWLLKFLMCSSETFFQ